MKNKPLQNKTKTIKMKKIIFSMLLLAVIGFAVIKIDAEVKLSEKEAILEFNEMQFDFGKVQQGETLEHIFTFKNTGTANLIIESVHPSCGCTGATLGDKKEYAPGETGEIKVTFNTQGREGINSKSISVTSNDKKEPLKTLSFVCEIIK